MHVGLRGCWILACDHNLHGLKQILWWNRWHNFLLGRALNKFQNQCQEAVRFIPIPKVMLSIEFSTINSYFAVELTDNRICDKIFIRIVLTNEPITDIFHEWNWVDEQFYNELVLVLCSLHVACVMCMCQSAIFQSNSFIKNYSSDDKIVILTTTMNTVFKTAHNAHSQ